MEMQLMKEFSTNMVNEFKACSEELARMFTEAELRIDTLAKNHCLGVGKDMQNYITDVQNSLKEAEEKNDARHLLTLNMCRLGAAATLVASGNFTAVQAVDQLSEIEWAMKTKFK